MIRIRNLSKSFDELKVIDDISFEVKKEEFVVFLGPNGCGKTTLLYILADILKPNKGEIEINGSEPGEAKTGFVFQNYDESMLPWRTVLGNVILPIENTAGAWNHAMEFLRKTNLERYKGMQFSKLSGGMKQLTAIIRALVYEPEFLLMDEPFSSLNYYTRRKMIKELLDIWREEKPTTLFVSHDVDEAILLADRIFVFSDKPMKIKNIIQVDLTRPRKFSMITSVKFNRIKKQVLGALNNE